MPSGTIAPVSAVLYVLSMDRLPFRRNRCMQRSVFEAYGVAHGRWESPSGQRLRILYALDAGVERSPELEAEMRQHDDLLMLPKAQACLGKVLAILRHATTLEARTDAVAISDDDAYIHPHRFVDDLNEHVGPGEGAFVYYGQMSFAAGWNETRQQHCTERHSNLGPTRFCRSADPVFASCSVRRLCQSRLGDRRQASGQVAARRLRPRALSVCSDAQHRAGHRAGARPRRAAFHQSAAARTGCLLTREAPNAALRPRTGQRAWLRRGAAGRARSIHRHQLHCPRPLLHDFFQREDAARPAHHPARD